MTNSTVPLIPVAMPEYSRQRGNYPDPNTTLGRAWARAWHELQGTGEEWSEGIAVATRAAEAEGLKPATMVGLLTRAATAGLLEKRHQVVVGERGPRKRTHYRIPQA